LNPTTRRAAWAFAAVPGVLVGALMQQLVIDEVILAPLGQFHIPSAWRTNITDVLESPVVVFWNLKKSGREK